MTRGYFHLMAECVWYGSARALTRLQHALGSLTAWQPSLEVKEKWGHSAVAQSHLVQLQEADPLDMSCSVSRENSVEKGL